MMAVIDNHMPTDIKFLNRLLINVDPQSDDLDLRPSARKTKIRQRFEHLVVIGCFATGV